MPIPAEILQLGNRDSVHHRGALGLLFHENKPVVLRSLREDARKEEAVFAPSLEKTEDGKDREVFQLFAQGLLADTWTTPGGAIEPQEFPEETVRREFAEEVVMSLEDHRPLDMRFAKSITDSIVDPRRMYEIPVPVVVQMNRKDDRSSPYLRGVFEVFATRIDLKDSQFYPLLGAGIFRYLSDIHVTERLRPTVHYLWNAYRAISAQSGRRS